MPPRLFRPSPGQIHVLIVVAFLSIGEALYLRYMALENATTSLACQGGLQTWLCTTFRVVIVLYEHSVFGGVALVLAALNLVRPSILLVTGAVAASGFGLVMHNAGLSGLAVGLLIVSLARRAPATEQA